MELKTKALSIIDTVILIIVKICSNQFNSYEIRFFNTWIKTKINSKGYRTDILPNSTGMSL